MLTEHFFITAELLGFNSFVPPFATAEGEVILKGVNYASGGSGIRDESGQNLVYLRTYIQTARFQF